jgi:hypothetical protein
VELLEEVPILAGAFDAETFPVDTGLPLSR